VRLRSLCVLFALAVIAMAAAPGGGGEILIDGSSGGEIACFMTCSVNSDCNDVCGCNAVCQYYSFCGKKVCNCTVCP